MTRTANPIEAIHEAVSPYVATGEAAAALVRWKWDEPELVRFDRFDQLRDELAIAAELAAESPVLDAMVRLYDAGDDVARLVVLQAFAPGLYRAAISLRFGVRTGFEECANVMLVGFCSALWSREDGPVPGAVLLARARREAENSIWLHGGFGRPEAPTGRFARLRSCCAELAAVAALLSDLAGAALRELARRRRAKQGARGRWEILGGELCRDGAPVLPPAACPLCPSDRVFGLWTPGGVSDGIGRGER